MAETFKDPYAGFRFKIDFGGEVAGVTEVSGIKSKTDVERIREGGNNHHELSMLKGQSYPEPLTLKKVFFQDRDDFYSIVHKVHDKSEQVKRTTLTLYMHDQEGKDVGHYTFYNCVPLEYEGPTFNAKGGEVAVEAIKIWYDYFEFTPGK